MEKTNRFFLIFLGGLVPVNKLYEQYPPHTAPNRFNLLRINFSDSAIIYGTYSGTDYVTDSAT